MKKFLSIALAIILAMSTLALTAFAAEDTVAKIGEAEYASLEAAFADAENGATITVVANTTISTAVTVTENITLVGKGVTITSTATDVFTVTAGTLTLGEGITVNSNTSILYANGGNIVVAGAVLNAINARYNLAFASAGSIEVKAGSLNQTGNDKVTVDAQGTDTSVIVSGGTVYSENSSAVCVRDGATLNITDGAVMTDSIAPNRFAAYSWKSGEIIVAGGEVSAANDNGLGAAADGIITVEGGTVDGISATGEGANIAITGGTVTDTVKSYVDNASITITGGTFSTDVSEFVAEGLVLRNDGTVGVPLYNITCESTVQGKLTAVTTAAEDEIVYVTVNPVYGYKLVKLVVTAADGSAVAVSGTSFEMPACAVTVSAIYEEAYPTAIKMNFKASVEAEDINAGEYKFELSYTFNGENEVIEVAKNNAKGEINFAPIHFNGAGTYTYYIKQIAGDNASVEYDATVYTINVKVIYTVDGELVATVAGDTAAFTNVAK